MRRTTAPFRALLLAATFAMLLAPFAVRAQEPSLFDRLGGMPAIEAVVDQFLVNVTNDARINGFFAGADAGRLRQLLVEQICQASGGPCTYTGRSMRETHMGMGVTEADFNALVEDLVMALDQFSVPEREKSELLAILGPLSGDIVEAPAAVPQVPLPIAQRTVVEIRGFAFNPNPVTVAVGSVVGWMNTDQVAHTATGQGFDTGNISTGQLREITFSQVGTFNYMCNIHNQMMGTVIVQ
jgi:hemoglobin